MTTASSPQVKFSPAGEMIELVRSASGSHQTWAQCWIFSPQQKPAPILLPEGANVYGI